MSEQQLRPRLEISPLTISAARGYVQRWHRHHPPHKSGLFAIGARVVGGADLCGVAIIGRPKAKALQDGRTVELVRLATDGTPNACSFLLAAVRRAAQVLGWTRVLTYTLPSEGGASLRAVGLDAPEATTRGGSWDRPSRARTDRHPTEPKHRWRLT